MCVYFHYRQITSFQLLVTFVSVSQKSLVISFDDAKVRNIFELAKHFPFFKKKAKIVHFITFRTFQRTFRTSKITLSVNYTLY